MASTNRSLAEVLSDWGNVDSASVDYLDTLLADPDLAAEDFAALVRAKLLGEHARAAKHLPACPIVR